MQITRMDGRWRVEARGVAMDGRPWLCVVLEPDIETALVSLVEELTLILDRAHAEIARLDPSVVLGASRGRL